MKMQQEFTLFATLEEPLPIGDVPTGQRIYFGVTGGEITGPRLKAKILGGGEWALLGPDGFLRVDVRLQAVTDDGAYFYIQYVGLLEMNAAAQNAIANGTGTEYGEQYFHTNPRIETGDERYAWLNTTFFVGEGRIMPGLAVEYRVWRPA